MNSKSATFITHKFFLDQNRKLLNITATLWSDPEKILDSTMNMTIETFEQADEMKIYVKVMLPDKSDTYNVEILNSVIDCKKLLNGIQGNFLAKSIMENLMKSVDFDLKFPFKKVRTETLQTLQRM